MTNDTTPEQVPAYPIPNYPAPPQPAQYQPVQQAAPGYPAPAAVFSFNPPPGWNPAPLDWQQQNQGWRPPTADWVPADAPGAAPAPAGWQFWVQNPAVYAPPSPYSAIPNPAAEEQIKQRLLKQAWITLGIGAGFLLLGIVITVVSVSMAGPGGGYFVFYGFIIIGIYRIVLGIVRLARVPSRTKAALKIPR